MSSLEVQISRAIIQTFNEKLCEHLNTDIAVAGAGPSGLMAAYCLAKKGFKVTIVEKRLSPGGGIWGGGMGMNVVTVQEEALPVLLETGISYSSTSDGVFVVDAIELAASLCLAAVRNGVALFNLLAVEDLVIRSEIVKGLVVNRAEFLETLPIDPLTIEARCVIDATGHEATLVRYLRARGLLDGEGIPEELGEGAMSAASAERFVVDHTGELYPGTWICGMSVCATYGGPRMGPIFGGMLLSGKRAADLITAELGETSGRNNQG
jgi:thiamine thiazole synthase